MTNIFSVSTFEEENSTIDRLSINLMRIEKMYLNELKIFKKILKTETVLIISICRLKLALLQHDVDNSLREARNARNLLQQIYKYYCISNKKSRSLIRGSFNSELNNYCSKYLLYLENIIVNFTEKIWLYFGSHVGSEFLGNTQALLNKKYKILYKLGKLLNNTTPNHLCTVHMGKEYSSFAETNELSHTESIHLDMHINRIL
ncbi:hypothetical protein HZS_5652, partial [Henneguya salminicola]